MSTTKIIQVWAVYETRDEYGRLGDLIGVYTSEINAKAAAKGQGAWGSNGSVCDAYAIQTDQGYFLLDGQVGKTPLILNVDLIRDRQAKIAQAKAKLTAEERELLGLE